MRTHTQSDTRADIQHKWGCAIYLSGVTGGQTLTQSQQTKTAGQYLIRSMREGWQQLLSLSHSLSDPFSICLSLSLSVPASHLPLMSPFPCASSCLSSTPFTSIATSLYFSTHFSLFAAWLHLPANHLSFMALCARAHVQHKGKELSIRVIWIQACILLEKQLHCWADCFLKVHFHFIGGKI